jgi:hypothetical protein
LDAALPQEELEELLRCTEAMADRPAETIIQHGSGWGALERRRREAAGEKPGWPASLVFDDESLTEAQRPWLELLEKGIMPDPADGQMPPSFMVQPEWRELLEQAVQGPCRDNWYAWCQLGVLRYSQAEDPADADKATLAWRRSLELKDTAAAHRGC